MNAHILLFRDPKTGKPRDPLAIFQALDEDGSGSVDTQEFERGLISCGLSLNEDDLGSESILYYVRVCVCVYVCMCVCIRQG